MHTKFYSLAHATSTPRCHISACYHYHTSLRIHIRSFRVSTQIYNGIYRILSASRYSTILFIIALSCYYILWNITNCGFYIYICKIGFKTNMTVLLSLFQMRNSKASYRQYSVSIGGIFRLKLIYSDSYRLSSCNRNTFPQSSQASGQYPSIFPS